MPCKKCRCQECKKARKANLELNRQIGTMRTETVEFLQQVHLVKLEDIQIEFVYPTHAVGHIDNSDYGVFILSKTETGELVFETYEV